MLLLALIISAANAATVKLQDGTEVTYMASTGFHNHRMETYFKYGADGRPTGFGLKIPVTLDAAFPAGEAGMPTEWTLFPAKPRCANAMPWDHVQINYNPNGHPGGFTYAAEQAAFAKAATDPNAINNLIGTSTWLQRHIDLHFSLVSTATAQTITCAGGFPPCQPSGVEAQKFAKVDATTVPKNYFNTPIAWVPAMGAHVEPNGGQSAADFAKHFSFIYGTYDGEVHFWETMITMTAFESLKKNRKWKFVPKGTGRRLNRDYPLEQAAAVDKTGYYPTTITFTKDGFFGVDQQAYTIEMTDLKFRVAPGDTATEASLCPTLAVKHTCKALAKMHKNNPTALEGACKATGYCRFKNKKGKVGCKDLKCKKIKRNQAGCLASPSNCVWNPVTRRCS